MEEEKSEEDMNKVLDMVESVSDIYKEAIEILVNNGYTFTDIRRMAPFFVYSAIVNDDNIGYTEFYRNLCSVNDATWYLFDMVKSGDGVDIKMEPKK